MNKEKTNTKEDLNTFSPDHVYRGGSWMNSAVEFYINQYVRVYFRVHEKDRYRYDYLGFRLLLQTKEKKK